MSRKTEIAKEHDWDAETEVEYKVVDKKLVEAGLPSLLTVMESLRRGMIDSGKEAKAVSLEEVMEEYVMKREVVKREEAGSSALTTT